MNPVHAYRYDAASGQMILIHAQRQPQQSDLGFPRPPGPPSPAPPPAPPPPPPLPKHLRLTASEQRLLLTRANDLSLLNLQAEAERTIAWKMLPTAMDRNWLGSVVRKFPMPRDTAFMLGPSKASITPPKPSKAYWLTAEDDRTRSDCSEQKLLILDLNSTLLYRPSSKRPTSYHERDHLQGFLQYIFKEFKVMIWSSARPENVRKMVATLIPERYQPLLVAVWARDTLRLTPLQYNEKTQVYKQLKWVWESLEINAHHPGFTAGKSWDQFNTILIDDSVLKARANPCNLLLVPEFSGPGSDDHIQKGAVLQQVAGYLEILRVKSNVSAYMKSSPFLIDRTGYWMPLGDKSIFPISLSQPADMSQPDDPPQSVQRTQPLQT